MDSYASYALSHPGEMEIRAAADLRKEKRDKAGMLFGLDDSMLFETADELLDRDKLADAAIIATQDRDHVVQAVKALEKGYDILLEKPISPVRDEVGLLERKAAETGRLVIVCHVLRYTPFYKTIKDLIAKGAIGRLMSLDAVEHVGYWHQAHSFIRGNWRRESLSSPMLMQKSCHDMDIIRYLVSSPCTRISSFGRLSYFTAANAPEGAARRCLDGCLAKDGCPFDAEKIYNCAKNAIATLPKNQSTKVLISQAVDSLNAVYDALQILRGEMTRLASLLPEYTVVPLSKV